MDRLGVELVAFATGPNFGQGALDESQKGWRPVPVVQVKNAGIGADNQQGLDESTVLGVVCEREQPPLLICGV